MAEMAKRNVESFGRIKPVRRNHRGSNESRHGADEAVNVPLSAILEFLTSQNHNDADLLNYSLAKLRLYYKRACERRAKEAAAQQLSTMHALLSALAAVEGNSSLFEKNEAILRQVISGEQAGPPKQAEGLSAMKRHLMASGARIAHSPLKK